jgi:hypothetical protein
MDFKQLLSIWWSFFWRSAIATPAIGFVIGAIVAVVVRLAGLPATPVAVTVVVGLVASILGSFWAIRATLKKHRLQPVADDQIDQPEMARIEPRFDA